MDIHKPKAAHSWREFLVEIGTITCGIAIALAGEQAIEALHWRAEVREFTDGIDHELADTLASFKYRADQTECVDRRLAELTAFQKAGQTGRAPMIRVTIGQPSTYAMRTGVWQSRSPEVFNHMPAERRLAYASLYDLAQRITEEERAENRTWAGINAYVGFSNLSSDQLMRLNELLFEAKGLAGAIPANYATIRDQAKLQGITPEFGARKNIIQPPDPALCKPLLRPVE